MAATTALTSCGIAYVLKYIQAAMQAGIELGIYPKDAQKMVAQSVKGAASLILNNDTHPSVEIDKVCTPGGMTIKGINELDHEGFDSAIIKAMKACLKYKQPHGNDVDNTVLVFVYCVIYVFIEGTFAGLV